MKRLKHLDIESIDVVHSWDYLPGVYAHLRKCNPSIRIVQDVPIALPETLSKIRDVRALFRREKLRSDAIVLNALKMADQILVPSSFVRDSIRETGIITKKISLVPFGVDAELFKPLTNKPSKPFRVAFCGAINNRKGATYLLEAWKAMALDAELHLYGRVYPEVKKILKSASPSVIVHGHVDIVNELPKNHIFVLPSLMEGSAKSIYEAMACGLPVITTPNSGSVVRNGREGFIVPACETQALASAIKKLTREKNLRVEMSLRARRRAEQYTWKRYGEKVLLLYKKPANRDACTKKSINRRYAK
ncbi:MAG: glycosyltransferase family 4 protein [Nitrosarchaeum sp.]|nr:glycosyltransferase family 4 protein [Nitrosarchaeum sp.]